MDVSGRRVTGVNTSARAERKQGVMTLSFSAVQAEVRVCSGCGEEFTPKDHRARVCKKNCGRYTPPGDVEFVGVDGEGGGDDPSRYVLFGIGEEHIENGTEGLTWKECFSFLYREFRRRGSGVAFVGFFLGYDFTQILKSLPEERARTLLTREGIRKRAHQTPNRQPHPVEFEGWQFDILGSKRLRIRPKNCGCRIVSCKCPKASWCYLCDVGSFFQTSFLNVINPAGWDTPICTQEEYEKVKAGKERRETAQLDDDMREYMHLEIELLERVMRALNEGFKSIGIRLTPKQWFGPGQAAARWLKGKVPKREDWYKEIPAWYLDAARSSYYGGWFETFCHGYIKGEVHEYDINSAYPSTIARLPCLVHGRYTRGEGRPTGSVAGAAYTLVKARVRTDRKPNRAGKRAGMESPVGAMLHRNSDGSVCRPDITEGWFWMEELLYARRAGFVGKVDYREWVSYAPCDCAPPFEGIRELYETRLRVGKNSVLGKACKLVYNSCYGKFAQSIGAPEYGNPIYASKITSGCRQQVTDAIESHPGGSQMLAMVATDAVFFLAPHPDLAVSNLLGEWDYNNRRNLTVFKPGVYWDDETRDQIRRAEKPKFKTRGINAAKFAEEIWKIDHWFQGWDPRGDTIEWPDTEFESGFSIVTALQALSWGKWDVAGRNNPRNVFHTSNPRSKRRGVHHDDKTMVWRSGIIRRDFDWETGDFENVISKPYEKFFGLDDPFSEESRTEYGVTEDGTVADAFRWLIRNNE